MLRVPLMRLLAVLPTMICLLLPVAGCGILKTAMPVPTQPPTPINFSSALQYAMRSSLVYESDTTIKQRSPANATVTIMAETPTGVNAYIETDDAQQIQWIVVRGPSNLNSVKLTVDYDKVMVTHLHVPLHHGFADAALQVYTFAKPLLKPGYEVHLTGHSLGGAAAAILLMLFKEDGVSLGSAITFGQPKVTNSQGVTTYRSLPLLRFVNHRDPVPLLPPLDLFSLLDDGPYKHFAPEVVLKDGPHYVYFAEHQA